MSSTTNTHWKISALALAIANTVTAPASYAAVITADGTNCTLIEAIDSANADSNASSPGCESGSGADIINLGANQNFGTAIADYTALPIVTSQITLNGNSNTISSTADNVRLIQVASGNLTVNDLNIANGNVLNDNGGAVKISNSSVTLNNVAITGSYTGRYGGGIDCTNSTLNMSSVTLSSNEALYDGGAVQSSGCNITLNNSTVESNFGTYGGAVNLSMSDVFSASSTVFSNNTSEKDGGAIYIFGGSLTLSGSTITGSNSMYGSGAGVQAVSTGTNQVVISNTTFSENDAPYYYGGGALNLNGATADVSDSTFTNNTNGIFYVGDVRTLQSTTEGGGAIKLYGGSLVSLSISNSTFNGNQSAGYGGAIAATYAGSVSISNSTFTSNTAYSYGGAAYLKLSNNVSIEKSLVNLNYSENGAGGLYLASTSGESVSISQSSIINNSAGEKSGGIYADLLTNLTISNSTISGNSAINGAGGGVFAAPSLDSLVILNSSLINNSASTNGRSIYASGALNDFTFINSIASSASNNCFFLSQPTTTSLLSNWFADDSCGGTAKGLAPVSALTQFTARAYGHKPLDAALIGGGDVMTCSANPVAGVDQTGKARGSQQCSIGAIEVPSDDGFKVLKAKNGKVIVIPI